MTPLRNQIATLWLAALCLTLAGCATTPQDVLAVACARSQNYSTERCAKGIAETYEVYQKRAEDAVNDPLAPEDFKEAVRKVEKPASEVIVELLKSTRMYVSIKEQLAAGTTTEEQVAIANANLETWVQQALPQIKALVRAVGG